MDPLVLRVDSLEMELARLRNQNRRLRRALILGGLLGFFLLRAWAVADKPPVEIKAQKFTIVNSAGTARAVLSARSDSKTGLEIRDGNRRMLLRLPQDKEERER
ncbi:hypothetical protein HS125_05390 [bacterium]|nr:hypothetical protein [bacterium]